MKSMSRINCSINLNQRVYLVDHTSPLGPCLLLWKHHQWMYISKQAKSSTFWIKHRFLSSSNHSKMFCLFANTGCDFCSIRQKIRTTRREKYCTTHIVRVVIILDWLIPHCLYCLHLHISKALHSLVSADSAKGGPVVNVISPHG